MASYVVASTIQQSLPPRESMSSCVSLDSRKGTCVELTSPARRPLNVEITYPSAKSDLLMFPVS
jgi:hypothetical protein